MSEAWGFDIDGVLAAKPPLSPMKWGRMNGAQRGERLQFLNEWYATARGLLVPEVPFVAISARKAEPLIAAITSEWLASRFGDQCRGLYLLSGSRTVERAGAFKAGVIKQLGLTDFVEDNKAVLKVIAAADTGARLWFWEEGMAAPVPFGGGS